MASSLRRRVMAAVLGSVALVGLASLVVVEHIERQQRIALTREAAENFVLLHKARVLAGIQYDLGLARKLADAEPLRRWILAPGADTLRPALQELRSLIALTSSQAAFYSSIASASFHYLDLAAVDALLAQSATAVPITQSLSESDPESDWFYKTLGQPQPYIFNVDYNTQLDITKLWINVVMHDGATPIGVVGTGVDISSVVDALIESEGGGVRALFINARGEIEGAANPALFGDGVATPQIWQRLADASERAALEAAMIDVETGRVPSRSLALHWDGEQQVAAVAFLPELQWHVLALHDPASVGSAGLTPLLGVLLVAVLVSSTLIALLGNRLLFLPLRRLGEQGEALPDEHARKLLRATAARADELGRVAAALLRLAEPPPGGGRGHGDFGRLVATLQQAPDAAALATATFAGLASALGVGQASLYRADPTAAQLQRCGAYARLPSAVPADSIGYGEGLLGQCAREQRAIDLIPPPPGFLRFGSALGDAPAGAVLLRPLHCRGHLVGVLEVATREAPTASGLALLDDLLPVLALCLDNLARQTQAAALLEAAHGQAAALESERRAASEQRAALQQLLDASPVCVAFSADDRFRYVNPAFERSFGHGIGRSAAAMYARPEDRPRVVTMLQRDGAVHNLLLPMITADGRHRPYRVTLMPYVHEGVAGILGWLVDPAPAAQAEHAASPHSEGSDR